MLSHNPYFNRWFSAIMLNNAIELGFKIVTILILIDGFLQYDCSEWDTLPKGSHNPYFNRWFSAIKL